MSEQTYNWSRKSLDELVEFYEREIAPERQREGHDPNEIPTYQWLVDHGYSGLQYAVREHYDMTLSEFFEQAVGLGDDASPETPTWPIDNEQMIEYLEQYFRSQQRGSAAETTLQSKRSRIGQFLRHYEALHGTSAIVSRITDVADQPEEIQRVTAVFDVLDDELESNDSKRRYRSDIDDLYSWLVDRGYGAFNPVRYDHEWDVAKRDNSPLAPAQVGTLAAATEDIEERLIVLGLCAWGLRRSELVTLHVENVELQAESPYLSFNTRKNGPGTVALIYGEDVLEDRIARLSNQQGWDGYLFPSPDARRDHLTGETLNRRFKSIAARADVRVRGELPTSKMGRRFWYSAYADAVEVVIERLQSVAHEQGSSDPMVVFRNYLSEEKRREYLRDAMYDRLAEAFEGSTE
ncbi:tyrosine-type recombinase/integrase [Halorubrum ezzemoulense]|uniref:tyrosine-type recombinase/integrase n=1 Tax=Halorubrum ezzemoulense TaxID=337243 RepID=UPI002330882B|nr:tyrosine-type recombinase/integrase [Halorubrum ezzemoulense]MDB2272201.1 tyrosine-type recombinase/integrase [Halorubrum ezzemoulense]